MRVQTLPSDRVAAAIVASLLLIVACSGTSSNVPPVIPPADGARIVVPRSGQNDVHPVPADSFQAEFDANGHIQLTIDWWSGVEPCTVLDSIVVERRDPLVTVTLREGSGPRDVACIAIAERHRTFVDLGEFEPGTYTIRDGTARDPGLEIVVS